jgi:hypothetical protein
MVDADPIRAALDAAAVTRCGAPLFGDEICNPACKQCRNTVAKVVVAFLRALPEEWELRHGGIYRALADAIERCRYG